RTRNRQRPEERRIDHSEQRRVEADADREGRHGDDRKARTLDEPATGIPHVRQKRFEHYNSSDQGGLMIRRSVVTLASAWTMFAATPVAVDQVLSYPFPDELIASPAGSTIAWTFNERGVRNIYAADGPAFTARRLTPY